MSSPEKAVARLAEQIDQRELEWSWANIDFAVKARFISRMVDLLPQFDPETEWQAMPVQYRRELAWHLSRTPEQLNSAWEADCEHLRGEADEETVAVFRELTGITAVMGG